MKGHSGEWFKHKWVLIQRPENSNKTDLFTNTAWFFYLQGRFSIAAKHHISVAEVYETELVDIDKVII